MFRLLFLIGYLLDWAEASLVFDDGDLSNVGKLAGYCKPEQIIEPVSEKIWIE